MQTLHKERDVNALFLAERFIIKNNERALPADLPKTYNKVDLLIGDVTYEGVKYEQITIKTKKYKYKMNDKARENQASFFNYRCCKILPHCSPR